MKNSELRKITARDLAKEIEALYFEDRSEGGYVRKVRFVIYLVLACIFFFATKYMATWVGAPENVAQITGTASVVLFVFAMCEVYYTPSQEYKERTRRSVKDLLSTITITESETELYLKRLESNKKQSGGGHWYSDVMCLRWVTMSKLGI